MGETPFLQDPNSFDGEVENERAIPPLKLTETNILAQLSSG
jgi:hypothetical protein